MAYRLSFDGVNDYVSFPNSISVDLGAGAYTLEVDIIVNALQSPYMAIIGRNGTAAGFFIMPNGSLAMYTSNSLRYQTNAGFFDVGTRGVYRLEHDSGGAWRAYKNGALWQSGTYTLSTVAAPLIWIGQGNNNSNSYLSADLISVQLSGVTNGAEWVANLSGGTGSTLPTVSGTNQGTLVNFTVPDCWVFYDAGGGNTVAVGGGIPKLTATAALVSVQPLSTLTFSGALPKLSASMALVSVQPISSLALSGTLPKVTAAASMSVTLPFSTLSLSGTIPKLSASAALNITLAPNSLLFSGALPKLRASAMLVSPRPIPQLTGDPLEIKQALINQRRAEEDKNKDYIQPVVIVPDWYIIQQQSLQLKQATINRARENEEI